jgi:CRISPR system Cascade subunit CasD
MSVLLLRLAGPMQSWGTQSRFVQRDTGLEPSRSGIIGMLCAALGWPRDHSLEAFTSLNMAVRVDREGRLMRDYHTAQNVRRADTSKPTQETVISERFYLADASFLVGLAGERPFLAQLEESLHSPSWAIFLGRKAFLPTPPLVHGIIDGDLSKVVRAWPWRKRLPWDTCEKLRLIEEVGRADGEPRQDVPLSFLSRDRRFTIRHVKTTFIDPPSTVLEPHQEYPPCS